MNILHRLTSLSVLFLNNNNFEQVLEEEPTFNDLKEKSHNYITRIL